MLSSDYEVKYIKLAKEYLEEKLEKVRHKSKTEEKKPKSKIFKLFSSIRKYF